MSSEKLPTAFYVVAEDRYFLGAVGLLNSLRLIGHDEPVFVLDCGLREDQRALLDPHVTLVTGPRDAAPHVLKTIAPLRHPAEAMVLIDADMIATRTLDELIEKSRHGYVSGSATGMSRFFPEWGELLDLRDVRPKPYISTGLVFLGGAVGQEVVRLMDERKDRVDFELTFWRRNVRDYPLLHADQDLLNAVLASRVDADRIIAFEGRLNASPPFAGLKVIDESTLRCAYDDGAEPYVVHHWLAKPWLEPTHHGVYSRLLRRLLIGPGLAIEVPERDIPLRLRSGLLAYAERKRVNARELWRYRVGAPLSSRVRALRARDSSGER